MADSQQQGDHKFLALKKFRTINTQPSREALKEDEFAWLENLMPIGDAFAQTVPGPGAAAATVTASIQAMHFVNLGTANYMITFTSAGGAQAVNLGSNVVTTIAAGGTFTTPALDQWKSERVVIADPSNGYFSWDGTLFHQPGTLATITVTAGGSGYTSVPAIGFSGGGGSNATATATILGGAVSAITITAVGSGFTASPTVTFTGGGGTGSTASASIMPTGQNGSAIATYSGRVWIFNGRPFSFTAPGTWYDFSSANAAGSSVITEGFLRTAIKAAKALDNYLYVFGDSSIFLIGDLKVTGSVTTFSLTALSSTTGTTLPYTVTAMERAIVFMNRYGVYALFGASVQKLSKALDGIFPHIDFSQPISAGLVQIYNIQCYAVSFTYQDTMGDRPIQAVFFDGKWFVTSQGSGVSFVAPTSISGALGLWGTSGRDVRQLYTDTTTTIATTMSSALLPFDSPIMDKQMMRAGIEYTAPALSSVNLRVDTEMANQSSQFTGSNLIAWSNSGGTTITWTNTLAQNIQWLATGFLLDSDYFDVKGKYIGFQVTSNSPQLIVNGILGEYRTLQKATW